MDVTWIHEHPPRWDAQKAAVLATARPGIFDFSAYREGDVLPGEWWRVEREEGVVVGYGWLEATWGDAEILLAVRADEQERGVGAFIISKLRGEAATLGLNYLYNVVPPTHPQPARLTAWLAKQGFHRHGESGVLRVPARGPVA